MAGCVCVSAEQQKISSEPHSRKQRNTEDKDFDLNVNKTRKNLFLNVNQLKLNLFLIIKQHVSSLSLSLSLLVVYSFIFTIMSSFWLHFNYPNFYFWFYPFVLFSSVLSSLIIIMLFLWSLFITWSLNVHILDCNIYKVNVAPSQSNTHLLFVPPQSWTWSTTRPTIHGPAPYSSANLRMTVSSCFCFLFLIELIIYIYIFFLSNKRHLSRLSPQVELFTLRPLFISEMT